MKTLKYSIIALGLCVALPLCAYAQGTPITATQNTSVSNVITSPNSVALSYKAHARLFGIIPMTVPVRAEVYENGGVAISYPWYGIFITTDTATLQGKVESAVRAELSPSTASIAGVELQSNTTLSAEEQQTLLGEISHIMQANFSISTST